MSCPDWRALSPETAAWSEAVTHFDSGCSHCRRDALRADPTLVFRGLRASGAPEMSLAQESSEVEAVRQAVAKWDALELEEAIIAAKGAGGMVRTMAEWAKHPQAQALATLPLLEIVKIGDAPAEKLREVVQRGTDRSVVFDSISNGVPISVAVITA